MVQEMSEAKELIDSIIPNFSSRKLVDSDEIVNVLLDLRKLLEGMRFVNQENNDGL